MRRLLPRPFAFAGYSQGTATLEGQVTDSSDGVIAGAVVKAVSSNTPSQWVSRSAFQHPDPVTQAGQFGNEGRNAVRGPDISNIDLSVLEDFAVTERARLQFRAECFNPANHANFGVLEAGAPRLMQFGIKLIH